MHLAAITLEKILKEFSIVELENIVFKNSDPVEHFLNLAEIESGNHGRDKSSEKSFND